MCEFNEDCEHASLAVRILHLRGQEGPRTTNPSRYNPFGFSKSPTSQSNSLVCITPAYIILLLNIIFCRIRDRVRCAMNQARLPRAHRAAARGGAAQGLGSCGRDLLSQPRVQRQRHMFHRAKNAREGRISVKFEHKLTVRTSRSLNGCLFNRHTFTILRIIGNISIFGFRMRGHVSRQSQVHRQRLCPDNWTTGWWQQNVTYAASHNMEKRSKTRLP